MSTIITGDSSAVSNSLTRTITGATNASPIVVTTSVSHLFGDGDTVFISGVLGNLAANGEWAITVLTANTFSLNTSTGSGAYTSGGTAVDLSLTPQFTIPSDGDAADAASVNVAFEALADRTQFLASLFSGISFQVLSATATNASFFTAPPGCTFVLVGGYGGGGGGAGAPPGLIAPNNRATGGGGGGGSLFGWRVVAVTPGTTYGVTIGAGGTGGATNNNGGDGTDTVFGSSLATFPGAQGGRVGGYATATPDQGCIAPGGAAVRGTPRSQTVFGGVWSTSVAPRFVDAPGSGGYAIAIDSSGSSDGFDGSRNSGYAGGTGSTTGGTDSGSYRGGGGGGGGAAGPGGAGANGGAGGNGGTGSTATPGANGSSASANTGAGGGGSGGGGADDTTSSNGGTGGNGGSGFLVLVYPRAT